MRSQSNKQSRYFVWAAFLILVSFFISCNLIKNLEIQHAEKKLDKIHWKFPDIMAAKIAQYYPPVTSTPTIDTNKIDKDSIAYYKKLSDSLKKAKQKILFSVDSVKVNGSCASVDSAAFEAGSKFGYQLGLYDGRLACPVSTSSHDTTTSSKVLALLDALTKSNYNKHDSLISITAQFSVVKKENNIRFWVMLGEGSGLLLFLIGLVTGKLKLNITPQPIKL